MTVKEGKETGHNCQFGSMGSQEIPWAPVELWYRDCAEGSLDEENSPDSDVDAAHPQSSSPASSIERAKTVRIR